MSFVDAQVFYILRHIKSPMTCVYLLLFRCYDHVDMCDVQYNTLHTPTFFVSANGMVWRWTSLITAREWRAIQYMNTFRIRVQTLLLQLYRLFIVYLVCRELCVLSFYMYNYMYVYHSVWSDTCRTCASQNRPRIRSHRLYMYMQSETCERNVWINCHSKSLVFE